MLNNDRFIYKALEQISRRKGYEFRTYSYGWIVEVCDGVKTFRLTWYTFDMNPPSGVLMARDKYATHTLLEGIVSSNRIIPSAFIPCTWKEEFIGKKKMEIAREFTSKHAYPLVMKDAHGSQGVNVFKVWNEGELLEKIEYFESIGCDAVLSTFIHSDREMRIILLDGEVHLAYYKLAGEGWKFNLSQWARAEVVDDEKMGSISEMVDLAKKVMLRLWLRFASCDFLIIGEGDFRFLEVNGWVCVDRFVEQNPKYREKMERMYEIALEKSFLEVCR